MRRGTGIGLVVGMLGAAGFPLWWSRAQTAPSADSAYIAPETCAGCHRSIWETYRRTGMARSFSRATPSSVPVGEFDHQASDSRFVLLRRDGKPYQRRYQLDPEGRPTNVLEEQVDYVMGSGNHARAYLHRTARGALIELPLGWYAEKGGYLAMNPGFDRSDHDGFRRKIGYDCMFCHNGYPKIPARHDQSFAEPLYADPLPEGIDCQRCHGPGRRHVQLAGANASRDDVRRAIVNPARLTPERREEVCMQCHLETTSFPLPNAVPRYGRGPFAYRPGEPLSNDWLFFDHARGAGRDDKFELVNAVYRIRQSPCFVKGAVQCVTCHNPHDVPRGADAVRHYDAVCRRCHASLPKGHTPAPDCAGCHMPKRRTEDVVHAVATDHRIQRRPPPGDLLADIPERHETGRDAYRGEVVLYYPEKLPATPDNDVYLALAQVLDRSNLGAITRLAAAIERHPAARPEFYFQLAEAWRNSGQLANAVTAYREAVRRNPRFAAAWQRLGATLRRAGQPAEAVDALQSAAAINPEDAVAWNQLGLAARASGKPQDAMAAFEKSIALDPDLPEPHSNLGIVLLSAGDRARAEAAFREAIRLQPDYIDAHNNLANLLSAAGDFPQARRHFEIALKLKPEDAATRYNFAMTLGRARRFDEAQQQLEACLRVDPNLADARLLLADLLMAKGQTAAALPHYREAVRILPASGRAHLGLASALAAAGDRPGAIDHLQKAAADPATRERATELLMQLQNRP